MNPTENRVDQFRNAYINACNDLRIDIMYAVLHQLKTLALSQSVERLDLSSINLGSGVRNFSCNTDYFAKASLPISEALKEDDLFKNIDLSDCLLGDEGNVSDR